MVSRHKTQYQSPSLRAAGLALSLEALFLQRLHLVAGKRSRSAEERLLGGAHLRVLSLVLDQFQSAGEVGYLKKAVVLRVDDLELDVRQVGGKGDSQNSGYLLLTLVVVDNDAVKGLEEREIVSNKKPDFVSHAVSKVVSEPELAFFDKKSLRLDVAVTQESHYLPENPPSCATAHVCVSELSANEWCSMNSVVVWKAAFLDTLLQMCDLLGDGYGLIVENEAQEIKGRVGRRLSEITAFVAEDGQFFHVFLLSFARLRSVFLWEEGRYKKGTQQKRCVPLRGTSPACGWTRLRRAQSNCSITAFRASVRKKCTRLHWLVACGGVAHA